MFEPGGVAEASELFCHNILQHRFVQRQVRHQPFEPLILFL